VPLEPFAGEGAWLPAVASIVPPLAAAFGPDLIVSQHGADSHAWDPLAHLRVTTTAMGAAARIVDRLVHLHAGGRWLSTGGGGYDAYRVVPRDWAHVWLAAAHREVPAETSRVWRERWAGEAARYGQAPLPATFDDAPNAGEPRDATQDAAEEQSLAMAGAVREAVVPLLLRTAEARGWWSPFDAARPAGTAPAPSGTPHLVGPLTADELGRLRLAERVLPPADAGSGMHIVRAAAAAGGVVVAAVVDDVIVGAGIVSDGALLSLGVAPAHRRAGVGRALLARLVGASEGPLRATVGVAERDPLDPLPLTVRSDVGRGLLESAGFSVAALGGPVGRIDRSSVVAHRR
jgi:ribosomal protein S18 acetylase RimI-like enzyme